MISRTDAPGPVVSGPRHVLLRYLSFALMTRTLLATCILTGLMEVLSLLEQMTPILQRHLGIYGVVTFMVLHIPLALQTALPLGLQIGALTLLTALTVGNETAILRSAGLSTFGLFMRLLPATFLIGMLSLAIEDQVTPRTEMILAGWWSRTDPAPEKSRSFWIHGPDWLAHIGYISEAGRQIHDVDLYRRDKTGLMTEANHASSGVEGPGVWIMHDVSTIRIPPDGLPDIAPIRAEEILPAHISAYEMLRLSMEKAPLSMHYMWQALHGRQITDQSDDYLRSAIFERLLRIPVFIVMLLLALPVIYIPPRAGLRSWLPVWCLGGGLLFIITQGIFRAMGNAGLLPAPIATIPVLLIFILVAGTVLIRNEDL